MRRKDDLDWENVKKEEQKEKKGSRKKNEYSRDTEKWKQAKINEREQMQELKQLLTHL